MPARRAEGPGGCVLHFGQHKTGSSSIQKSLSGAEDLGRYSYVGLGMPTGNASWPLIIAFAEGAWKHRVYRQRGIDEEEALTQRPVLLARLAEEIAAAGARTSIISAEDLSRFEEREFANLVRAVSDLAGPVRAVGYIRSPRAYMESSFQQRLRSNLSQLDFNRLYVSYRRFEAMETVLGRENLSFWRFAPSDFPGGDVVRDFCARLGVEIADERIVRVNDSLSRPAVSILLAYQRFGRELHAVPPSPRANRMLIKVLRGIPGPRLRFADSAVASVLEANADDLAWIEERLGEKLTEDPVGDDEGVRAEEELFELDEEALSSFLATVQAQKGVELPDALTARLDTEPRVVGRLAAACVDAIQAKLNASGRSTGTT